MDGNLLCDQSEVPVDACNLCAFKPPTNPVVTTCGHSFCWPCMYRFLQGQAKPCPVCTTMLSSDINVVPTFDNNGALILCLPTTEDLERTYDMLDWSDTVSVPEEAWASSRLEETEKRDVILFDEEMKTNVNVICFRHQGLIQ